MYTRQISEFLFCDFNGNTNNEKEPKWPPERIFTEWEVGQVNAESQSLGLGLKYCFESRLILSASNGSFFNTFFDQLTEKFKKEDHISEIPSAVGNEKQDKALSKNIRSIIQLATYKYAFRGKGFRHASQN